MRHVITLSSVPPRFDRIGPVLQCLLAQKLRPEAIELYIPRTYRRFPEWGGGLPEVPEGVTIVRVEEDLGPATKVLPAARARRGQAIDILYVDDDRTYGRNMTRISLGLRKHLPCAAICGAGFSLRDRYDYLVPEDPVPRMVVERNSFMTLEHQWRRLLGALKSAASGRPRQRTLPKSIARSGYTDIAEGYSGVLIRPDFFDDAAFVIPPVLWAVDDIWLSGMLARRGIPIWADRKLYEFNMILEIGNVAALFDAEIDGAGRDEANRACVDYLRATYGVWGGTASQST
jgi:hypothetical protein